MIRVKDLQLILPFHTNEELVLTEFVEFNPYFTKVDDKIRTMVWLDDPNIPETNQYPVTELRETESWNILKGMHQLNIVCEVLTSYAPLPDMVITGIWPLMDVVWTKQAVWINLYDVHNNIIERHELQIDDKKFVINLLVSDMIPDFPIVSVAVNNRLPVRFNGIATENWKNKPLKFKFGVNPLADKGPIGSCCVEYSLVQIEH